MKRWAWRTATLAAAAAIVCCIIPAGAQTSVPPVSSARNFVAPQARSFVHTARQAVRVTEVKVEVSIVEQVATTTMDIGLHNPSSSRQEAELLVPVPDGAVVRGFAFSGPGKEPTVELLPKDKAVAAYEAIVAKVRDPALLEFAGMNLIRSSVFPVDAGGKQKIRLTYEHLLPADGDRVDYFLPRTESLDYSIPWEVSVRIRSKRAISTVYSPSHRIELRRERAEAFSLKVSQDAMTEPGPLQLSYLMEGEDGVTASLLAYPDPKTGGGYFLLLAGLPTDGAKADDEIKREVTIVIDRSGSMNGEKLDQAKAAALQVLAGLADGEAFNVIDYSETFSSFAPAPVLKDDKTADDARHYIRKLRSAGGTNIHDTLVEALGQAPTPGMLPIVLFLTDGLPTVGVKDEVAIRTAAVKANRHDRRIFTFGVGYDVNAPLLTHLADKSRAASTFVLPNEDVEAKVAQVFNRLSGPVLAEPELAALDSAGAVTTRRLRDVQPARLPDLFEGDRLVLLGRYEGDGPLHMRLRGNFRGKPRTFRFEFALDKATTRNSFVPRLWASRRIAALIEEIRQAGAAPAGALPVAGGAAADPRTKELVDEIVRLSAEFGILTEYTAFLAREGTNLDERDSILRETGGNLSSRAVSVRSGVGAFNQAVNGNFQQQQIAGNRRNWFYDANMNRVQTARVQQMNDRAFFQQNGRWVDGNAVNAKASEQVDRTVTVGSPEFRTMLARLVRENRNGVLSMSGEVLLRVDGQNVLFTIE